jgi:hypothetical protein
MNTLYDDKITGDVIGSLPLGGYFLENMNDPRLSRRCRWLSTGLVSAEFDLGAATDFDTIAIVSHNLTDAATITVKTGATAGFSTAIDTFSISHEAKNIYQAVTQTGPAQYVRFEFTDTANPDGYIDIGRLMAGPGYTFPGFAPVVSRDTIERGYADRSGTDQVYGEKRYRLQRLSVEFPDILEDDRPDYEDYLEGTGVSVAHIINIDESDICSFDFGIKNLYVTNEEVTESLELNEAGVFTTRHTMREAY